MNEEEYDQFVNGAAGAELHPLHEFEKPQFFEGCLLSRRLRGAAGSRAAFGPMKPVGLADPLTGKRPFRGRSAPA